MSDKNPVNSDILERMIEVLEARKSADPANSYVAGLYERGTRQIAKKLGEETTELIIDAMRLEHKPESEKRRGRVVSESADVLFHFMILLSHHNIPLNDVLAELDRRAGVSGLEEKAGRPSGR